MKKVYRFSKFFISCAIFSVVLIISGIFALVTKNINFGIDFKPGLVQEVCIAAPSIDITYKGTASVSVQTNNAGISFIISGVGAENEAKMFYYSEYPTAGDMVKAFNGIAGVIPVLRSPESVSSNSLFMNSGASSILSEKPFTFHYLSEDLSSVSTDDVRNALSKMSFSSNVKMVGNEADKTFQIRVGDDGSDKDISEKIKVSIMSALADAFGEDNIAVIKTDFIGSQFSASLVGQSAFLLIGALLLIWIYATVRFHWDFALAAIVALIHDALIMVTFVTWTQIEFDSLTLAAILTVVGYSINDTVVIFDRVRENMKLLKVNKFTEFIDTSLSECLSRTFITTITTLLAVFSLFIFTTGSMKNFALVLMVGLLAGTYSSLFISSGFVSLIRRNWKQSDEEKRAAVSESSITI